MRLIFKYFENGVKYLLIIFLLNATISQAQESTLVLSNKCTKGISPFTKVNGIDRRFPEKELGFVLTGWLNNNSKVSFKGNFIDSLSRFFLNKDVSLANDNEISIILYDFSLSEKAEEMKNIVSFKLSMRVFKKIEESRFEEIFSIDTLYRMSSSTDLTKKLLKSVNEHLCEVAVELNKVENLRAENKPSYTVSELQILDSIEKMKTPIYITDKYKPGIYYDFNQFKNNSPDTTTVYIDSIHTDKIRVMTWSEEKEKNVLLDNKSVYAVCDGNFLLKATRMGFYDMKKEGSDFYFFGQVEPKYSNKSNRVSPVIGSGVSMGVGIGVALISNAIPLLNNYKINYRTGNPIQVDKDE
ncbi:MAG: hypothetical protein ACKVQV_07845 [Bacteroidia bacterium]